MTADIRPLPFLTLPIALIGELPAVFGSSGGGLVTSTLLNLFVVPSLYLRFARARPLRR